MLEALNGMVSNIAASLRLQDAIDIAIVAFLLYRLILLIRDTRAILLVQGIFVIIIIYLLSSIFQLRAINWLINRLIPAGVLAIPIIFQEDLRRGLEVLGRGIASAGIAGRNTAIQKESSQEELVRAVDHFALHRIGALIVLERQTGLQDIIDTGILLQSMISYQLLINIFIPNTPLHDGALVIRDEHLEAAACILPLSSNSEISQDLGTRHRAAIGLTEKSDALVIVVSEETGTISLAQDGKLTRYLDGAMLSTMLQDHFELKGRRSIWWSWLNGEQKDD
ncbi:MAG: diadenylate cyclase CdaA [Symbiobacteriaceae bacterium]|nr:diadenylate cyclase CdaA [Symbiobacteriaceae bacterium]